MLLEISAPSPSTGSYLPYLDSFPSLTPLARAADETRKSVKDERKSLMIFLLYSTTDIATTPLQCYCGNGSGCLDISYTNIHFFYRSSIGDEELFQYNFVAKTLTFISHFTITARTMPLLYFGMLRCTT
jgi:hypothetical protein